MLPAELVRGIEGATGISVGFPRVGAPYGLMLGDSLITLESPEHLYVALRINLEIEDRLPAKPSPTIVEIEPRHRVLAAELRASSVESYTIIDLPLMNVVQGYFLAQSLGHDRVLFNGEPDGPRGDEGSPVRILPTTSITSFVDKSVDVLINENSMPEMPLNAVETYVSGPAVQCADSFTATITRVSLLPRAVIWCSCPKWSAALGDSGGKAGTIRGCGEDMSRRFMFLCATASPIAPRLYFLRGAGAYERARERGDFAVRGGDRAASSVAANCIVGGRWRRNRCRARVAQGADVSGDIVVRSAGERYQPLRARRSGRSILGYAPGDIAVACRILCEAASTPVLLRRIARDIFVLVRDGAWHWRTCSKSPPEIPRAARSRARKRLRKVWRFPS